MAIDSVKTTGEPFEYEVLAKAGHLHDAVVSYVGAQDWVSFAELKRVFEPYMPTRGDYVLEYPDTNILIHVGMSQELVELVLELVRSKAVYYHPAEVLTYLVDGELPNLPIARDPKKAVAGHGYKKPHWLPLCLRVVPLLQEKPKRRKPQQMAGRKEKRV